MTHAAAFAGVLGACWLTARALTRARWPRRSPRVAIVCWQAVGLALGLSAIGLPLALALDPYRAGTAIALLRLVRDALAGRPPAAALGPADVALITAGLAVAVTLLWTTVTCLVATSRLRRRHRALLALVARADPAAPGALVLDHPGAAAYCLPGMRPRVVVSAGALDLLDGGQLAAVLSHERAHARERHDLVLLPFTALCRALPGVPWVRAARDAVGLLIEMRADDRARRTHADRVLVAALLRFATAPARVAPPGALAVTGGSGGSVVAGERGAPDGAAADLAARVDRLLDPGTRAPGPVPVAALALAQVLVAVPLGLFLL